MKRLMTALVVAAGAFGAIGNGGVPAGDFIRVSEKNPKYLAHADGSAFIPTGPCICFVHRKPYTFGDATFADGNLRQMESWIRTAAANGANFTRLWLCAPEFQVEHAAPGVYDEAAAKRLDHIVKVAGECGVRLKLCLESFYQPVRKSNGPLGSFPLFSKPCYTNAPFADMAGFLSGKGDDLYLRRAAYLAARYRDNPTVAMVELWNETDCSQGASALTKAWVDRMLTKVQALFPNQMVVFSQGSCDNPYRRGIYRAWLPTTPGCAVAQIHNYLNLAAPEKGTHGPIDLIAAEAVSFVRDMNLGKPTLLAEFGAVKPNHAGPSELYGLDTDGVLLHDGLFAAFFSGACGPAHFWHWDSYLDRQNVWYHIQRFNNAIAGLDPIAEDPQPFRRDQDNVRVYGLKGKSRTWLWCKDAANDWRSEFVDGRKPSPRALTLDLADLPAVPTVRQYDPWKDRWTELKPADGKLTLTFTRATVLVF